MATPKKSSGSSKKTSKKSSSSSSVKNGKTIGSTRTAPKKTAEYKSKYANKNVSPKNTTSGKSSPIQGRPMSKDYKSHSDYVSALNKYLGRGQTAQQTTPVTEQTAQTVQTPDNVQAGIDLLNSADLSASTKAFYTDVFNNWDPNLELSPENIIKAFENIKKTSIDPHHQDLADIYIAQVETASEAMQAQRALETESEAVNAAQDIKNTQANLEASGMTFSGAGVEQLGTDLAASVPFGGASVEGLVPQRNRLISTSSEAAYKQNLKNLGLGVEQYLGSKKTKGLVSGYNTLGGITGSFEESKQGDYGSALSNLINQQTANVQQGYNLDV